MWRFSRSLLRAAATTTTATAACASASTAGKHAASRRWVTPRELQRCWYASLPAAAAAVPGKDGEAEVTAEEARRLMRLANVEALKRKLGDGEVIPYAELLRACEEAGAARTRAEAAALAGALDEAGVVLLFRDKVYLQPDKVSSPPRPPHCFFFSRIFSLPFFGLLRSPLGDSWDLADSKFGVFGRQPMLAS